MFKFNEFNETLAWLILALPVGSFLLNGVVVRAIIGPRAKIAGYLTPISSKLEQAIHGRHGRILWIVPLGVRRGH